MPENLQKFVPGPLRADTLNRELGKLVREVVGDGAISTTRMGDTQSVSLALSRILPLMAKGGEIYSIVVGNQIAISEGLGGGFAGGKYDATWIIGAAAPADVTQQTLSIPETGETLSISVLFENEAENGVAQSGWVPNGTVIEARAVAGLSNESPPRLMFRAYVPARQLIGTMCLQGSGDAACAGATLPLFNDVAQANKTYFNANWFDVYQQATDLTPCNPGVAMVDWTGFTWAKYVSGAGVTTNYCGIQWILLNSGLPTEPGASGWIGATPTVFNPSSEAGQLNEYPIYFSPVKPTADLDPCACVGDTNPYRYLSLNANLYINPCDYATNWLCQGTTVGSYAACNIGGGLNIASTGTCGSSGAEVTLTWAGIDALDESGAQINPTDSCPHSAYTALQEGSGISFASDAGTLTINGGVNIYNANSPLTSNLYTGINAGDYLTAVADGSPPPYIATFSWNGFSVIGADGVTPLDTNVVQIQAHNTINWIPTGPGPPNWIQAQLGCNFFGSPGVLIQGGLNLTGDAFDYCAPTYTTALAPSSSTLGSLPLAVYGSGGLVLTSPDAWCPFVGADGNNYIFPAYKVAS